MPLPCYATFVPNAYCDAAVSSCIVACVVCWKTVFVRRGACSEIAKWDGACLAVPNVRAADANVVVHRVCDESKEWVCRCVVRTVCASVRCVPSVLPRG